MQFQILLSPFVGEVSPTETAPELVLSDIEKHYLDAGYWKSIWTNLGKTDAAANKMDGFSFPNEDKTNPKVQKDSKLLPTVVVTGEFDFNRQQSRKAAELYRSEYEKTKMVANPGNPQIWDRLVGLMEYGGGVHGGWNIKNKFDPASSIAAYWSADFKKLCDTFLQFEGKIAGIPIET